MEREERVESDHQPIVTWIKGRIGRGRRREGEKQTISREVWNEESRKDFIKKIERLEVTEEGVKEEIRRTIEEYKEREGEEKKKKKG